jgi:hypothetical protein
MSVKKNTELARALERIELLCKPAPGELLELTDKEAAFVVELVHDAARAAAYQAEDFTPYDALTCIGRALGDFCLRVRVSDIVGDVYQRKVRSIVERYPGDVQHHLNVLNMERMRKSVEAQVRHEKEGAQ